MAIDRVGSGSAAQRAAEQLAQARAAAARATTPETGGTGARRAADATSDATGIIARAAARAGNLHALTAKAESVSAALEETTGLLDEMREILRDQTTGSKSGGLAEARARLADIAASIARAEAKASGDGAGSTTSISDIDTVTLLSGVLPNAFKFGFVAANVNPSVGQIAGKSTLPPGSVRDIELNVLASATTSDIRMSFGRLGQASSTFTLEFEGADGAASLVFVSGTTLSDMASAINSRKSLTGVSAVVDRGSIRLGAPAEDGQFVSVRTLDDEGLDGGIRDPLNGGFWTFDQLSDDQAVRDDSSAFHATIAGEPVTRSGNTIYSNTSEWDLRIVLDFEQFNHPGTHDLFLLFATLHPDFEQADVPPELTASMDGSASALGEARAAAAQAQPTDAISPRLDAARAAVGTRLAEIRALLQGSLGEARASADATLASLLREGPKSGWRIDAKG